MIQERSAGYRAGHGLTTIEIEFQQQVNGRFPIRMTHFMARSQDKTSASSGFFIVHHRTAHLDSDYAVFGCVTGQDGYR